MSEVNWEKVQIRMNMKNTQNENYSEVPFRIHQSKISEVVNNTGTTNEIIIATTNAITNLTTSTLINRKIEASAQLD